MHYIQLAAVFSIGLLIGAVVLWQAAPERVVHVESAAISTERQAYIDKMVDTDAMLGDPQAPVTIVEFSDFQCPFCRRYVTQTMPEIQKNFIDTGKVRYVYRDYSQPNPEYHPGGYLAAQAAECAGEQDMYWQAHAQIFAKQAEQGSSTIRFGDVDVRAWFAELDGLDQPSWRACYDAGKYISEINKDTQDGANYGVSGTPSFFINGMPLSGAQPYPAFAAAIQRALIGL